MMMVVLLAVKDKDMCFLCHVSLRSLLMFRREIRTLPSATLQLPSTSDLVGKFTPPALSRASRAAATVLTRMSKNKFF